MGIATEGSLAHAPQELQKNLKTVVATLNHLRSNGIVVSLETLDAIQKNLGSVVLDNPEYWRASEATINYASFVREKNNFFPNAEVVRQMTCQNVKALTPENAATALLSNGGMSGCSQEIDQINWKNYTFENCIIIYHGGPLHLENVTFKNCLFLVSLPTSQIRAPAKTFTGELLAKSSGPEPVFTLSAG